MGDFKATHHGRLHGVPVWLDMTDESCPAVCAKYSWVGETAMDVMELLYGCFTWVQTFIDPYYEPMYAIKVCGEVKSED